MILILLIASVFCSEISPQIQQEFIQYLAKYGKSYATKEEYNYRLDMFAKKHEKLAKINSENANFEVGHNKFSDWTDEEYKKLLGFKRPTMMMNMEERQAVILSEEDLPDEVDWRKKGAVNPVKDQGQCGSCWAFSATCAIEGAHFIKTGELLDLAEQQLVDCDKSSNGCNGGMQDFAMKYVEDNPQELQKDYPYLARDEPCKFVSSEGKVKVSKINDVPERSVEQLKAAIAKGPVSVTIEADTTEFGHYTSGIFDTEACGTNLDHAVTAVGYGSENGQDFYIVRNSWSASWGENGYIRIAAKAGPDGKGICGIQQVSLYPTTD